MAIQTLTPEQMLSNLARIVKERATPDGIYTKHGGYNGSYKFGKAEIAQPALQLAELVEQYLAGELQSEEYNDEIPF